MRRKAALASEKTYLRFRTQKRNNERSNDTLKRLAGIAALLDLAGILDRGSAERLRRAKREMDRRLRLSLGKTCVGMAGPQ